MKPDLSQLTKRYYTIGEVAEMFGVTRSLIRYWESEFEFLKPHKNSKGDRRFTIQNIDQFAQIYQLVKEQGFTLDGARKVIKNQTGKPSAKSNPLLKRLQNIRKGLQDLHDRMG
ncbi:MAG: MerR family transcriptional regulator [Saprospiraceae bacterium]|nr:MerR family transcriptional regulator [Saprospiraceae bacterium]